MASIVVVQRAGGDAGVRECRDRGCAALRDRNGGDCRQISYRRNRASAEERKSSCYDVRQGRRYPPNRRRHPFGGRSLPRFFVATPGTPATSWRTSPPFSEIGYECARRRLLPPPQVVSAEVHGLSVGGLLFRAMAGSPRGRPPECRERLPNGKSDYRENTPTHLARWRTRLEFDRRSSR